MKSTQETIFPIPRSAYSTALKRAVRDALREDLGSGDITTAALGLKGKRGRAVLLAKSDGILAGADAFTRCFRSLDPRMSLKWSAKDGNRIRAKQIIAAVSGDAAAILSAERSGLNFIAHLSGIATTTARMVALLSGRTTRLLDTRKTAPGLRLLEKHATTLGGALNHRLGLYDALMLKDNHIAAIGTLERATPLAVKHRGKRQLICEVTNLHEIEIALKAGVTWLLLDNFNLRQLPKAIREIRRRQPDNSRHIVIEISGGVTPGTIGAIARLEVDYVSSGWITHSAPALNFSLEWSGPPAMPRRGPS